MQINIERLLFIKAWAKKGEFGFKMDVLDGCYLA
nr:hypothetical protein [uncultured bacterium]